jgi:uncharacterized membrane protein YczE
LPSSGVNLKKFSERLAGLLFGLFLYALGIAFTIEADFGYAPWDVFHKGISNIAGISIGNASIALGLVICVALYLLQESLGLGTLLNMVVIGAVLDLILESKLIPVMDGPISGTAMMVLGLFVISLATFFYMRSGFGSGPRDGLMVALERRSGLPVGICRAVIESLAVLLGWLMGGPVGFGTLIAALGTGVCIQITFSLLGFNATEVKHEDIRETALLFLKTQR